MLGGYQILDLTNIDLEITTSAEDITDSGVLKQLLNLREYIDENYDFTRPLNNKLKPLLIRLRDAEENEEIESSVWGNLSITKTGFVISANVLQDPLLQLQLFVSFEKAYDDDGNAYWVIDDAKIMLSNSLNITGDLQAFEEITDKDGHKRFIEGEVKLLDSAPEGVTLTYGKWSLCGTHLMIVICLNVLNTTVISNGTGLCDLQLPEWIFNKIVPVWANAAIVLNQDVAFADDWSSQTFANYIYTSSNNRLVVSKNASLTLSATRNVRITYDLLIDNE